MRWKDLVRLGAIGVAASAITSVFGAVQYRLNGVLGTPTGNTINVQTLTDNSTLIIFATGGAGESIPPLTVQGSIPSNKILRIAVVPDGSTFPSDPTAPDFLLAAACSNFGGLTFGTNTALRDRSRLALTIAGDITGAITVGQLFSINAPGTVEPNADLTATAANGLAGFDACELVRVGELLEGDVVATLGDIARVRVWKQLSPAEDFGIRDDTTA